MKPDPARKTSPSTLRRIAFGLVLLTAFFAIPTTLSHANVPSTVSHAKTPSTQCDRPSWVASWALPIADAVVGYDQQTVRVVATPNFGGSQARIRLSNALSHLSVTLDSVHVGRSDGGAQIVDASNVRLTFAGGSSVTIPAGGSVVSDPANIATTAFEPIAISFYAPLPTGPASGHSAHAWTYVASGNHAAEASGTSFGAKQAGARFVSAVDVLAPNDGLVVALGDSITQGYSNDQLEFAKTTPYTDTLARRLHDLGQNGGPRLSLVNVGISGNRILEDGAGPSAVKRLDRDVLAQSGLAGVVMMEGINDLAAINGPTPIPPSLQYMSTGYRTIIDRVRAAGAEIWLSPLTPAGDTARPTPWTSSITPEHVTRRHEINRWIRSQSGAYDGRVDFETVVLDPQFPNWLKMAYDSGDNLHPNTAGLDSMGHSVDLSLFSRYACTAGR